MDCFCNNNRESQTHYHLYTDWNRRIDHKLKPFPITIRHISHPMNLFLLFLLPCLTSALITKYDPIQINSASIIYQKYYMFDKKSTPASNNIGNGQSFIELNFEVKKNIPDLHSRGTIEAYIATEEFFNHIGYVNNGAKIACCDESSYGKQCNHLNHLVVPPGMEQSYVKVEKTMEFVSFH